MSCEKETATTLRGAGQKITPQRMLILSALRHKRDHVTASAVLEEVRRAYAFIDISTVYRTLGSAKDLNLVTELNVGGGDTQFEWTGKERHHHLVCRVCGGQASLDSTYLESLATALVEDHGFEADLDHFGIVGVCRACRGRQS